MGHARRRARLREQVLKGNPECTYCFSAADTVEHMPPKIIFTRKHRPKGLEFPCCLSTGHADLVAACISRSMVIHSDDAEASDLQEIFAGLKNNVPGLLEEMLPSKDQLAAVKSELPGQRVLNVGGPLVAALMQMFSAKLTFALYRERSGRVVPASGGVLIRWFSNYEHRTNRIHEDVFRNLMPPRTLSMGKFEVSDQFAYSYEMSADGDFARIVATFRYGFAVAGFISANLETFAGIPATPVQRGCLLKLDPRYR